MSTAWAPSGGGAAAPVANTAAQWQDMAAFESPSLPPPQQPTYADPSDFPTLAPTANQRGARGAAAKKGAAPGAWVKRR
jgi:hypothetical protein